MVDIIFWFISFFFWKKQNKTKQRELFFHSIITETIFCTKAALKIGKINKVVLHAQLGCILNLTHQMLPDNNNNMCYWMISTKRKKKWRLLNAMIPIWGLKFANKEQWFHDYHVENKFNRNTFSLICCICNNIVSSKKNK